MRKRLNSIGVLGGITAAIMAMSIVGGMGHPGSEAAAEVVPDTAVVNEEETNKVVVPNIIDAEDYIQGHEEEVPDTINGLLIGFDRTHGLTDVIMVGHIDPKNNQVQVISIPRDLEIYFTEDEFKEIKTKNPNNRILHEKINNLYSLIGWDEAALKDIRSIVEVITGLEMDYMMTLDIDGFEDVVDAVGGVEFYVPQDMYYHDPAQDLLIDLDEGLQILDGNKAEQLVRYRKGYSRGDLQRIEVQQDFVSALVDQVIHKSDFNEIQQVLTTGYNMIDTDFGVVVMLEYAEFFFNLELEHILAESNMMTIPSWGEKVDGRWYQYFDLKESREAVNALINNEGDEVREDGR